MSRIIVLIVLFALLIQSADAQLHEFKTPDGKSVKAEIMNFNARLGQVTLKRADGKQIPVKPGIFVEKDQAYIRDWCAAMAFLSDSTLNIRADDEVVKSWKEEEKEDVRYSDGAVEKDYINNVIKYEDIAYNFSFKNMGGAQIRGLVLEYCVYYEQSTMCWEDKPEMELKTWCGKMDIPEIGAKQQTKVTSKPVMVYEDDINPVEQADGDQRRPGKGKILGMHARVSMKGKEGVREFSVPETFSLEKYPWETQSSPNSRKPYRKNKR